ncbi:Murein hydrolase activator NlpD, partial [hydrothermal vent metagenome]
MKIYLIIFVFIIVSILAACTKHRPAPVLDASAKKQYNSSSAISKRHKYQREYVTVKTGDTLYSIGFSYDIDYKTLAKINNIHNNYKIYPGQKLRLKAKKSLPSKTTVQTTPILIKSNKLQSHKTPNNKPSDTPPKNNKQPKKPMPMVKNTPRTTTKVSANTSNLPNTQPKANTTWIWPVKGKIISSFSHSDSSRKGIDIATKFGFPVYASNNGTVVYSGDGLRGYGELIIIKHSSDMLSAYAHNSKRMVKEGQTVKQGQE